MFRICTTPHCFCLLHYMRNIQNHSRLLPGSVQDAPCTPLATTTPTPVPTTRPPSQHFWSQAPEREHPRKRGLPGATATQQQPADPQQQQRCRAERGTGAGKAKQAAPDNAQGTADATR